MEAGWASIADRWVPQAVEQYEARFLRFAARLLGDEDSARDAVQQAFLRLCGQGARAAARSAGAVAVRGLPTLGGRRAAEARDRIAGQ